MKDALFGPSPRRIYESHRAVPDFARLHQELQSHRHLTLQLWWEEYHQNHPDGYSYTRLCELYRHWRPEIWQLVERHEMKPGMNEFQAVFALGMGVPERQSDPEVKTVHYPNGGNPLTITYRKGKAVEITKG